MTGPSDWSGALGLSWHDHVDGLEATLAPINNALTLALHLQKALNEKWLKSVPGQEPYSANTYF
ncbi:MAG: hypothetical protein AB8G18_12625 [Gammaproteobacteria bacterium]